MGEEKKELLQGSQQPSKVESFGGLETKQMAEHAAISVAASAKAEIESAFIIALKMPRSIQQARIEIADSCKNVEFAGKAIYKKPVAGKFIEGPSIRFAEEMIRSWGNIKVQHVTIYEDEVKRISRIVVMDLQKNISYSAHIVVEKIVERKNGKNREVVGERVNSKNERVFIVKATDDEIRNKELTMVSKEIRNASLRLIPQYIIDEAMAVARKTLAKGVSSDVASAMKPLLEGFAELNIKPNDLEQYLGHKVETVSPAELLNLRAVYTTIKDGEATWQSYIEKIDAKESPESASFEAGDPKKHTSVKDAPGKPDK